MFCFKNFIKLHYLLIAFTVGLHWSVYWLKYHVYSYIFTGLFIVRDFLLPTFLAVTAPLE